jgi:hypothetical protein
MRRVQLESWAGLFVAREEIGQGTNYVALERNDRLEMNEQVLPGGNQMNSNTLKASTIRNQRTL